jgi:hypothetical protein
MTKTRRLPPDTERKMNMKALNILNRTAWSLACAALTFTTTPTRADDRPQANLQVLVGNAGVTVVATPTSDSGVLQATATGVVQTSLLGNCVENAQITARFPANPADPVALNGTVTLTASDGTTSLNLTVAGTATPDPANPFFYNAKYTATITGGTGAYASARGLGQINEVIMFTSPLTATVTWNMKALVTTPR